MYRDSDLLKLAQGQPCLLNVHPYCDGDLGETTVACHSNQLIDGKGKGLKADDCMTVWGCYRCHTWLDQGDKSKKEKATTLIAIVAFEINFIFPIQIQVKRRKKRIVVFEKYSTYVFYTL